MTQAFLFDYDDTLVKTTESKYAAIKELAKRHYNHSFSDEEVRIHWGKPFKKFFMDLFAFLDDDIERVIERYLEVTVEFPMHAHPEALQTLTELLQRFELGIVTSASRAVVIPDLERLGFPLTAFSCVQTCEDTACHKPDPKVFEPVLQTLLAKGIERTSITYVGDSVVDFRASTKAGLDFIGVLRGTTSREEFEDLGARFVHGLDELLREIP